MNALSILKPYLIERRRLIFAGILSLIVVDFLQLMIPRFIRDAVDALTLLNAGHGPLVQSGLKIFFAGLLIAFFRYCWRRFLIGTSRRVEEGLRNRLFFHLQTLSPAYFDQMKTGDLMAHATNDVMNIRMAIGMGLVALTDAVVLGTSAIGFMAYINVRLTLFAMIPAPFIILGSRILGRRMHRLYAQVQGDFSILTEAVRERFSGIRLIKAHHGEAAEAEQVADISKRYVASNISLAKIIGAFFPMMLFFSNLSMAAVLYLGGRQTITAAITPGDFVAFISYLGILTWPMMALGWVSNLIQRGKASLDRLARIFETGSRIVDGPHATPITNRPPRLELRGVSFSHNTPPDAVSPILSDLHLDLAPGYMMGIVGPPGGGKTALLNLIARLYDVTDGGIYLDGEDIRTLTLESVRRRIAVVPQEPFLFAGTIRDNIQLETDGNRETDMIEAARQACLHETVRAFPRGYDTVVGEKGVILSGGQKQRVALARAFFRNAPLLLLDDPISQVDTHTGQAIVRTLREQAGDKTVVIASHRLSALTFADHIITLKNGHIQEAGTHARLMSADGYYAETYRMQEIQEALLD